MSRKIIVALAGILIAAYLLPFSGREVGDLVPVETLALDRRAGMVELTAGEELVGRGKTVPEALADLQEQTPGELWLEQTRYLLVTNRAKGLLGELKQAAKLRLACRVYDWSGEAPANWEAITPLMEVQARWERGLTLGQALNGAGWTLAEMEEEGRGA